MDFNVHISANILFMIIYIVSRKMETLSPGLLFIFWGFTRIPFNIHISTVFWLQSRPFFGMYLKTLLSFVYHPAYLGVYQQIWGAECLSKAIRYHEAPPFCDSKKKNTANTSEVREYDF